MTIIDFLLALVAEDEAEADGAGSFTPWSDDFQRDNYGHLTVQPARVLAECEAKRQTIDAALEVAEKMDGDLGCVHSADAIRAGDVPDDCYGPLVLGWILEPMARVHAKHPDFDPAWAE